MKTTLRTDWTIGEIFCRRRRAGVAALLQNDARRRARKIFGSVRDGGDISELETSEDF